MKLQEEEYKKTAGESYTHNSTSMWTGGQMVNYLSAKCIWKYLIWQHSPSAKKPSIMNKGK